MHELNKKRVLRSRGIMDVLTSLPKDLHATYDRILSNVEDSFAHEAVSILKWLSCSGRPMFAEELAEACIIRPGEEPPVEIDLRLTPSDLLEILPGLITVDPPIGLSKKEDFHLRSHIFSLAHFSVKEYLFKRGSLIVGDQTLEINAALAQRHIVECCFSYVSFCELNDVSLSHKPSVHRLDQSLPLKLYSYSRWAIHAASIPESASEDLMIQAIQLFRQPKICHEWISLTRAAAAFYQEKNKPYTLDAPRSWHTEPNWPLNHLLCYSIVAGNVTIVKLLLEMGIQVSGHTMDHQYRPLELAAKFGQSALVDILLVAGANKTGALLAALHNGHEDIARKLLHNSEHVDGIELIAAAKRCSTSLLKALIEKAPGIEFVDVNRAIYAAISSSNFSTANVLLEAIVATNIPLAADSSKKDEIVWHNMLSSALTLNSRSLLRFLLREVPLNVIDKLNTEDLYLLSTILGCSQATQAFASYPWFMIPTEAKTLAQHWDSVSVNSTISATIVGIHDICIGRGYTIPRLPMQPTAVSTWDLLKRWKPDLVCPLLEGWGITNITDLTDCEDRAGQQGKGMAIAQQGAQPACAFSNNIHEIKTNDEACEALARKFVLELMKSSNFASVTRGQRPRSQSLNVRYDPPLPGMQRLLQQRMKTYMVLSGPYSPTIKDFIATEISRSCLLSSSPTPRVEFYYETTEGRYLTDASGLYKEIFKSLVVSSSYQNTVPSRN
jgi:ankyrin repeat protein